MNIWEIILDSGPVVKFVLFLLVVLSIVSWGIVFYYKSFYKRIKKVNKKFLNTFFNDGFMEAGSMEEFDQKISSYKSSPLLPVWKTFHKEFKEISSRVSTHEGLNLTDYLSKSDFERNKTNKYL